MKHTITAMLLLAAAGAAQAGKSIVVEEAQSLGVRQCLPTIKSMTDFVLDETLTGVNTTRSPSNPDQGPFYAAVESTYTDGANFTFMNFTPRGETDCAAGYTKIFYLPVSCESQAKEMSDFVPMGRLQSRISHLRAKNLSAYLMPAGNGCILIRQEFDAKGVPAKPASTKSR